MTLKISKKKLQQKMGYFTAKALCISLLAYNIPIAIKHNEPSPTLEVAGRGCITKNYSQPVIDNKG